MTGTSTAALALWFVLSMTSVWLWLPAGRGPAAPLRQRTPIVIAAVALVIAGTGAVAWLASSAPPVTGRWAWLVTGQAFLAALLTGGAVTRGLLAIADRSRRQPGSRVRRSAVLPGGAWIGAAERLAVVASILLTWSEGIAVIVALKGLARFPELKAGQGTGAAERFILGTFASLGWAATCAGVGLVFD